MNLSKDQILELYRKRRALLLKVFKDDPEQLVTEMENIITLRDLSLQKIQKLSLANLNYAECELEG